MITSTRPSGDHVLRLVWRNPHACQDYLLVNWFEVTDGVLTTFGDGEHLPAFHSLSDVSHWYWTIAEVKEERSMPVPPRTRAS